MSPKLKSSLRLSNKKPKNESKVKKEIKKEDKIVSQSEKPKVKELIRQFESNVTVRDADINVDTKANKKGDVKDAFEALMCRNVSGDTPIKNTPVRKKVKQLDLITSKNQSILNWVSKSDHKGTILNGFSPVFNPDFHW